MNHDLSQSARGLVDGANFAVITTLLSDGSPSSSVVWITRDGEDLLVSTTTDRVKYRTLRRDPRCTVIVYDLANPYRYLEVRGTATMTQAGGRELIDSLNLKYTGNPNYPEDPAVTRVVVRITPQHIVDRSMTD